MGNYSYPIDSDWTTGEIQDVILFLNKIEAAYESSVDRLELLTAYDRFKVIVPSKMQEKQIGKAFEKQSGYQIYPTIKQAKESSVKRIKMPEQKGKTKRGK